MRLPAHLRVGHRATALGNLGGKVEPTVEDMCQSPQKSKQYEASFLT